MLDIVNHHDWGWAVNDLILRRRSGRRRHRRSTQWQQVLHGIPSINVLAPNFSQDYLYTNRNYFLAAQWLRLQQTRTNNFAGYAEDNIASFLNDRKSFSSAASRDLDTRGDLGQDYACHAT